MARLIYIVTKNRACFGGRSRSVCGRVAHNCNPREFYQFADSSASVALELQQPRSHHGENGSWLMSLYRTVGEIRNQKQEAAWAADWEEAGWGWLHL